MSLKGTPKDHLGVLSGSTFTASLSSLEAALADASYVAIDLEFTGLQPPGSPRPSPLDTPASRYSKIYRPAAQQYCIIQVGMSIFRKVETSESPGIRPALECTNFSYFVRPDSSVRGNVLVSTSTVQFLTGHGMDWGAWMSEGVPYTDARGEEKARERHNKEYPREVITDEQVLEHVLKPKEGGGSRGPPATPKTAEDVEAHSHHMTLIRDWLDSNTPTSTLSLPPMSPFLRKLVHQDVESTYPGLTHTSYTGHFDPISRSVKTNPTDSTITGSGLEIGRWSDSDRINNYRTSESEAKRVMLDNKIGFRRAWSLLVNHTRGRFLPVIFHNGMYDLCYLMQSFNNRDLPEDFEEFCDAVKQVFPVIYDTKYLASQVPDLDNSNLSTLFRPFKGLVPAPTGVGEHDAAYDAYMTGVIFSGLPAAKIPNRMGFPRSMGFVDLARGPSHLFVDGLPYVVKGVEGFRTGEVREMCESMNIKIQWVDDDTCIVVVDEAKAIRAMRQKRYLKVVPFWSWQRSRGMGIFGRVVDGIRKVLGGRRRED